MVAVVSLSLSGKKDNRNRIRHERWVVCATFVQFNSLPLQNCVLLSNIYWNFPFQTQIIAILYERIVNALQFQKNKKNTSI